MMPRLKLQWGYVSGMSAVCQPWRALLRQVCVLGAVLVAVVPAARGHHVLIGWWPLWLLGMPLLACWAAHGFAYPCPAAEERQRAGAGSARRVVRNQARRRGALRPGAGMTTGRGQATWGCGSVRGQ